MKTVLIYTLFGFLAAAPFGLFGLKVWLSALAGALVHSAMLHLVYGVMARALGKKQAIEAATEFVDKIHDDH